MQNPRTAAVDWIERTIRSTHPEEPKRRAHEIAQAIEAIATEQGIPITMLIERMQAARQRPTRQTEN